MGDRLTGIRTHEMYRAVSDACYVYQYRDLEHNLWKFGWRQARKRVLLHGALSREWINRVRGELRLRRRGLEISACFCDLFACSRMRSTYAPLQKEKGTNTAEKNKTDLRARVSWFG
jgi:hypothetical protein